MEVKEKLRGPFEKFRRATSDFRPQNYETKEALKLRHNRELKFMHFSIWILVISVLLFGRNLLVNGWTDGWSWLNFFSALLALVAFVALVLSTLTLDRVEHRLEEIA